MQSSRVSANDVFAAPLETLPEGYGQEAVRKATQQLFTEIYEAAKQRDSDKLAKIRNNYILQDDAACFSVIVDGYTPFTLLIKEGNIDAASFLYARHRHPIMDLELSLVTTAAWRRKKFLKEEIEAYPLETIYDYIHCVEILRPHLTNINKLEKHEFLDKHFLEGCAHAFSGNAEKVSKFFSSNWLLTTSNACVLKSCIAYILAKYHPDTLHKIKEIWPGDDDTRQYVLKGFFAGGHFNKNKDFIEKKTNLPNELVSITLEQMFHCKENIMVTVCHSSILQSLLACIDRDDLRVKMAAFLNLFEKQFNAKFSMDEVLQKAHKINRYMRTYYLNYEQALLLMQPTLRTWLLQGMQLVMQGKLPDRNTVIKIASSLAGSAVPEIAIWQLYFVMQRHFLINALDHYLSLEYKTHHYHLKRAASFKEACLKVNSINNMSNLLIHQISLFNGTAQAKHHCKVKHEKPYGKKGRDEFIHILEKYAARF